MSRIVLAMSGGVDSSVAAWLLKEAGHEVIGVFMRHGEEAQQACAADGPADFRLPIFSPRADHKQGCCSASDAEDARRVADKLDIPFYALNLEAEFRQIIDYFVAEYTRGRTPNPCVQCNNWLKFGKLFDYADSIGAEFVATGHYARVIREGEAPAEPSANGSAGASPSRLLRGIDGRKDQSYVLFGIERITIGQRKKLGVAMGEPYFVVRIEPETKKIVIGRQEELARSELTASDCNWLVDPPPGEFSCSAKIRYNTPPAPAIAESLPNHRLQVRFEQPRSGVAPGQAVVLYDGECVLGGGWIDSPEVTERQRDGETEG